MDTKTCTMCNIDKHNKKLNKNYPECIDSNRARGLKRYYENKDEISNQQKIYYKKIEKKY